MSLKATIHAAVNDTFRALGDLVKTGVLKSAGAVGYDWDTGTVTTNSSMLNVQVILTDSQDSNGTPITTALIRSSDLNSQHKLYDTLEVGGEIYHVDSLQLYEGIAILQVTSQLKGP